MNETNKQRFETKDKKHTFLKTNDKHKKQKIMQATINYTAQPQTSVIAKANAYMQNEASKKIVMFASILLCLVGAINF